MLKHAVGADQQMMFGSRVWLFGSGAGPGTPATGRGGSGYRKRASGRVRVKKLVPVQDSTYIGTIIELV